MILDTQGMDLFNETNFIDSAYIGEFWEFEIEPLIFGMFGIIIMALLMLGLFGIAI